VAAVVIVDVDVDVVVDGDVDGDGDGAAAGGAADDELHATSASRDRETIAARRMVGGAYRIPNSFRRR
jgi:hypothetical protein